MPESILGQAIVTYLDSFIAVGGFGYISDEIFVQTTDGTQIYQLKWNCSSSKCEYSKWDKLEQSLTIGRSHAVAMMIPDFMTNCDRDNYFHVSKSHI